MKATGDRWHGLGPQSVAMKSLTPAAQMWSVASSHLQRTRDTPYSGVRRTPLPALFVDLTKSRRAAAAASPPGPGNQGHPVDGWCPSWSIGPVVGAVAGAGEGVGVVPSVPLIAGPMTKAETANMRMKTTSATAGASQVPNRRYSLIRNGTDAARPMSPKKGCRRPRRSAPSRRVTRCDATHVGESP